MKLFRSGFVFGLAFAAICSAQQADAAQKVAAHRGASSFAPENTLAAFSAAAGYAEYVELDVQKSADGELVIIHDDTVDRTTNGTGAVASMTLAQLKALDAGSKAHASFAGQTIPTFAEAINAIRAQGMKILIERKSTTVSAAEINNALNALGAKNDVIVQSFDWPFITALRALDATLPLGVLGDQPIDATAIANAQAAGANMMAYAFTMVDATAVAAVHAAGMEIYAWTVMSGNIQIMADLGCDGLITNDPRLASDILGRNTFAPNTIGNSLVSYWKLDASSALDSHGTNNGTPAGSPTWLTGANAMFGGAVDLNGTNQRIDIPNSPTMDIGTNAVTLSLWVKLGQLPAVQTPSYAGIFDANTDCFVIYVDRPNKELRAKVSAGTNAARPGIPEAKLDTTAWHHVVATYDGAWGSVAGETRIYYDGKLMSALIGDGTAGLIPKGMTGLVKPGQVSAIGANGDASTATGTYFQGAVDDVALWKRPMGQSEVAAIYNAGRNQAKPLNDLLAASVPDWSMY